MRMEDVTLKKIDVLKITVGEKPVLYKSSIKVK